MKGTAFIGAIEIYTDVTPTYHSIQRLVGYMKMSTVLLALVLVCGLTLLLLAQAKQKLDAKKHQRLAADMDQIMRHDLKAPLSTLLQGFDFLTQETDASEEQRELFQDLKKVAYRMLHSINSSLTLRKIETGGYVTTKEPVDIPALLADIQADLSQLLQRKKLAVVLRRKNTQQGFTISGDHALLYSILANLLKNALEASAREQEITIILFSQDQNRSIAIRNNGAVPVAIRATFFDKYVTSNKPGGTGFGTYAAKLMTEIQGGQIRLECNDEAKSTTVYVSFPA